MTLIILNNTGIEVEEPRDSVLRLMDRVIDGGGPMERSNFVELTELGDNPSGFRSDPKVSRGRISIRAEHVTAVR